AASEPLVSSGLAGVADHGSTDQGADFAGTGGGFDYRAIVRFRVRRDSGRRFYRASPPLFAESRGDLCGRELAFWEGPEGRRATTAGVGEGGGNRFSERAALASQRTSDQQHED